MCVCMGSILIIHCKRSTRAHGHLGTLKVSTGRIAGCLIIPGCSLRGRPLSVEPWKQEQGGAALKSGVGRASSLPMSVRRRFNLSSRRLFAPRSRYLFALYSVRHTLPSLRVHLHLPLGTMP